MNRPGNERFTISVVLTCYNEGERLRGAYDSLKAQTDPDFEVVIVSDASTDAATNETLRRIELEGRAIVIRREKNGGPAAAKNSGVEAMNGEVCVPLDGDDILPPYAINAIRKGFERFPEADFVFGDYIRRETQENVEMRVDCSGLCHRDCLLDPSRLAENWMLLCTSPCRKAVWDAVGGHSEAFSYNAHDADFFMRLLSRGYKGYYVNEMIYVWNRSPSGINSSQPSDSIFRLHLANMGFFDKFGDGLRLRENGMRRSFSSGDAATARRLARELVRRGRYSLEVLLLSVAPISVVYLGAVLFARARGRSGSLR